jgi:hypothetical protein
METRKHDSTMKCMMRDLKVVEDVAAGDALLVMVSFELLRFKLAHILCAQCCLCG